MYALLKSSSLVRASQSALVQEAEVNQCSVTVYREKTVRRIRYSLAARHPPGPGAQLLWA